MMRNVVFWLTYVVTVLLLCSKDIVQARNLVVATYNLWNVMFQWDARKHYIAEMIRLVNADVIGFQEVRSDLHGKRNQLKDLQELLTEYKYSSYHVTSIVEKRFGDNALIGWEKEGLGILSKHSIAFTHQIPLSRTDSKDKTPRALLHAQIQFGMHEIFFVVTHFSTDKLLQCQNAMRFINFISSTGGDRTIIVGDFNTYLDYSWPLDAVQNGFFLPKGCPAFPGFKPVDGKYGFDDTWLETNADERNLGLTFSNMPSPGFINRPDRILVSRVGLHPVKTTLHGKGGDYMQRYSTSSYISRLQTVISMTRVLWYDRDVGYSCYLDCGPHGSCRCGVCVGGGNTRTCELSECPECTALHYNIVLFLYYTSIFYVLFSIYVLAGLFIRYSKHRTLKRFVIFSKFFKVKYFVLIVMVGVTLFCTLVKLGLSDMIATVLNRIPEEMYASDHLMVVSEIKITFH